VRRFLVAVFLFGSAHAEAPKKCPAEMAPIAGQRACVDRWEASLSDDGKVAMSRARVVPAAISQLQARAACEAAGKHLCTRAEWTAACKGPGDARRYSYGKKYVPGRCHDKTMRDKRHSQKPLPTGSLPACRTPEGVYDLSGNVWEWLATDKPDAPTAYFVGGGFGNDDSDDNLSCVPEDPLGQPVTQVVEALGFRCCLTL
jgi:formylglycine-generating enzyme required for sulfatase activity